MKHVSYDATDFHGKAGLVTYVVPDALVVTEETDCMAAAVATRWDYNNGSSWTSPEWDKHAGDRDRLAS